jgi:cytochrome c
VTRCSTPGDRRARAAAPAVALLLALVGCSSGTDPPAGPEAGPTPCPGSQPEPGFSSLFDGTPESLAGWRQAGPGGFQLENCTLRTYGGLGLLWHERPLSAYELRVDWRLDGDDNSGVFVGFPDPGGDPGVAIAVGREVQIDATDTPDATTGAVYAVQAPDTAARDRALAPPGEWNTFTVTVQDRRIVVELNGVLVNEYVETDQTRLVTPGHVGLQNHGEADDVSFRRVRVRVLD